MPTELDEIAVGLVVGRSGQPIPLSKPNGNVFLHKTDYHVLDKATNKHVYRDQKPLSFIKEVIEIYSSPGDWILAGPTGIGM